MKILKVAAINFASYPELSFDFTKSSGVTLVSGPTGSGKSTFCDVITWTIFGKTAKDGNADEIIPWGSNKTTEATVIIELSAKTLSITRIRSAKNNDLYYIEDGTPIRGKDLKDTQKLINDKLGCDANLYLSGAYLNEFSQTTSFFTANAKVRKAIVDQLVDTALASSKLTAASEYKKEIKQELVQIQTERAAELSRRAYLENNILEIQVKIDTWAAAHTIKLKQAIHKAKDSDIIIQEERIKILAEADEAVAKFHSEQKELELMLKADYAEKIAEHKTMIEQLDKEVCKACGASKNHSQKMVLTSKLYNLEKQQETLERVKIEISRIDYTIYHTSKKATQAAAQILHKPNVYKEQLEKLKTEVNPYITLRSGYKTELKGLVKRIKELSADNDTFNQELADIDQLIEVISIFREMQTRNTVANLQDSTNTLLIKYFDGEITVQFDTSTNDKIDVTILKDGNACVYSQLSKGQRQLLRFCFGISIMKHIARHHSISFSSVFFDEVFTGLDSNLIAKGFSLLQSLHNDYQNIFVVEHNDNIKAMADQVIDVSLTDRGSILEKA